MCDAVPLVPHTPSERVEKHLFYNSKELGVYTYSRTKLYLPLLLQGEYYNDMFRPYMWAIFRL